MALTNILLICVFTISFYANVYCDDAADECRPKPPEPGKEREVCCKIPDLIKKKEGVEMHTALHECMESLKANHPDLFPEGLSGPPAPGARPPHPRGPPPIKVIECIQECFFNNSGLMTADMKPNSEAILGLAENFVETDKDWKPISDEAIKKCTASPPKVKDDAVCKSGAHQISLCIVREAYLHCPPAHWTESEACKAEKALMEKCEDMPPPFFPYNKHKKHH
uniref:Odorant-binding protein 1 n=1 Tax=Riptortus pedestris TaxID=329032 RepID=A0A2Z4HQ25_RIPPE|nr:odorant-binding protein 1 [Riptortus pedestris]